MPAFVSAKTKYLLKLILLVTVFTYLSLQVLRFSNGPTLQHTDTLEHVRTLERTVAKLKSECLQSRTKKPSFEQTLQETDYLDPWISNAKKIGPSRKDCSAKRKVAFAKTHKTGSSSLQNIFFRFGVKNNLTFAMPPASWMFSFQEPFDSRVVLEGPWKSLQFDMFIFHSIWNYPEVHKVLPSAVYVSILRDPIDAFESNYVYMGLQKAFKMDINEFATNKAALGMTRGAKTIIGKNQLLWDLGMPAEDMENVTLVAQKVAELDQQFDLVLIAEFFQESLVMLRELLCWPREDMAYLRQNERMAKQKSNVTAEARSILKDWLWADYVLYDHFLKRFREKAESFGIERIRTERTILDSLNEKLRVACVKEKAGNDRLRGEFKMAVPIVLGYVIDERKPWCALFARSEPNFVRQIRAVQNLRATNMQLQGLV